VYEWPGGCNEGKGQGPVYVNSSAPTSDAVPVQSQIPAAQIEQGAHYLRAAAAGNPGYLPSETTAPLQFAPEIKGEC